MILFDMDGVLATYEQSHYRQKPMLHEIPGYHYFRTRPANETAIATYKATKKIPGIEVGILSRISPGAIGRQQRADKIAWLKAHGIETDHCIITSLPKTTAVKRHFKIRDIPKNMVLIDDYNENLVEWQSAGGTACKFCNGDNNPDSFDGPCISSPQDVEDMLG